MDRLIFFFFSLFLLIGISTGSSAENNKIPEWLDTVAPQIVVSPDSLYHNSIFHKVSALLNVVFLYYLGTPYRKTQYVNPFFFFSLSNEELLNLLLWGWMIRYPVCN
jgi:hypothetical protein